MVASTPCTTSQPSIGRALALLASFLTLAACGTLPGKAQLPAEPLDCGALYARFDAAVDASGVRDAQTARIPGYPYLRADRLHAALRGQAAASPVFEAWLGDLIQLGQEARNAELANLPRERIAALHPSANHKAAAELKQRLDDCAAQLKQEIHDQPARREQLLSVARVPDDYSNLARAAGLYPLAAIPFSRGVSKMHEEMHALYARGDALAKDASVVTYAPPQASPLLSPGEIAKLLRDIARNGLGLMQPSDADAQRLFATFAPVIQVRTVSGDDRLGAPAWNAQNEISVDAARPMVYQLLSHARYGNDLLLQLNYVFWFPARPKSGRFDLLGGQLDGLTWRVTLAGDGSPLLYDTMHNCGCYHQFFPSANLRIKADASRGEGAFIPHAAPALPPGSRIHLGIDASTHYLFRVAAGVAAPASAVTYAFADYNQLRSLPRADGSRRSLFGANGIIAGSERGERFFFWPMGIESAGAMRQWGRHATAFVGRRHFDDANLVERYFELP